MCVCGEIDLRELAIQAIHIGIVRCVRAAVLQNEIKAHKTKRWMKRLAHICKAHHRRDGMRIGTEVAKIVERKITREEVEEQRRLANARSEG